VRRHSLVPASAPPLLVPCSSPTRAPPVLLVVDSPPPSCSSSTGTPRADVARPGAGATAAAASTTASDASTPGTAASSTGEAGRALEVHGRAEQQRAWRPRPASHGHGLPLSFASSVRWVCLARWLELEQVARARGGREGEDGMMQSARGARLVC